MVLNPGLIAMAMLSFESNQVKSWNAEEIFSFHHICTVLWSSSLLARNGWWVVLGVVGWCIQHCQFNLTWNRWFINLHSSDRQLLGWLKWLQQLWLLVRLDCGCIRFQWRSWEGLSLFSFMEMETGTPTHCTFSMLTRKFQLHCAKRCKTSNSTANIASRHQPTGTSSSPMPASNGHGPHFGDASNHTEDKLKDQATLRRKTLP